MLAHPNLHLEAAACARSRDRQVDPIVTWLPVGLVSSRLQSTSADPQKASIVLDATRMLVAEELQLGHMLDSVLEASTNS